MAGRPEGYKVTEETKKKISLSHLGKKLSDYHRMQISLAQKGKKRGPLSEETKHKISLMKKGKVGIKGRIPSLEVRQKMSVAAKLRNRDYLKNENHWFWKGDKANYRSKHKWMEKNYGKPDTCEHCLKTNLTGHKIHWANKSHSYKRIREDWLRLCTFCHKEYDIKRKKCLA